MVKKKKKTIQKSKLIGKGSYGCVFKPMIPCKKDLHKPKNKKSKTKISKIMIKKNAKTIVKEFAINKLIQKIPNYKEWAYIWTEKCDPPKYEDIKKISEIDICLKKYSKDESDYNKGAHMLIGEYGGIPLSNQCMKLVKKGTFGNKKQFLSVFLKIFKYLEPVFKGINELKKNNICHQDLSHSNVMFKNNKAFIIDFGLSCKFSDKQCIKERSLKQMKGSRIYDPYPYDYIYLYGSDTDISNELSLLEQGLFRNNHPDYLTVHKDIFNRQNIEESIYNNLLYEEKNKKIVIQNLDVYSLGILVPMIFVDIAEKYNISKKVFLKCFDYTEIQNHLSLFKGMTEYHAEDRIPIEEAYERYNSLL